MRKIKVLIFGLSDNYGGMESYVYNLYKNINKEKIQFDFVDTTPAGHHMAYANKYKEMNSTIHKITKRSVNWKKSNNDIINIFKNNTYDYIHFHVMNFMWWEPMTLANKYSDAQIIVHSHSSKMDYDNLFKNLILDSIGRVKVRKIKYFRLACGEAAGKYLFKGKPFIVMENGIDIKKYSFNKKSRKKIRNEFKIDGNCTLFGHVGNFYVAKNYPKLLNIFNEYVKLDNNAKLILVGNYNNDPSVKKRVQEMKLENNIIFAGLRNDVNELYSAFDIFLFPSFYEGLSISMIEAQISGLDCFASDTIDKKTKITENVSFIDIKEDSAVLAKYIYNNHKRINRNQIQFNHKYDVNNSSKKLEKFYEREI